MSIGYIQTSTYINRVYNDINNQPISMDVHRLPTHSEYGICEDICKEVYSTCQFAAYPSFDSCLEGCFYNEEEGADLDAQYECFQEAACDTFEIIECENTYGAQSDD